MIVRWDSADLLQISRKVERAFGLSFEDGPPLSLSWELAWISIEEEIERWTKRGGFFVLFRRILTGQEWVTPLEKR
jgi:hypothetical protein